MPDIATIKRLVIGPVSPDRPIPGFYKVKLRQGGPWRPAKIARRCGCNINGWASQTEHDWETTCDRFPHFFRLTIGHLDAEMDAHWPYLANNPIAEADYRYLMDLMDWEQQYGERQDNKSEDPPARDLLNEPSLF